MVQVASRLQRMEDAVKDVPCSATISLMAWPALLIYCYMQEDSGGPWRGSVEFSGCEGAWGSVFLTCFQEMPASQTTAPAFFGGETDLGWWMFLYSRWHFHNCFPMICLGCGKGVSVSFGHMWWSNKNILINKIWKLKETYTSLCQHSCRSSKLTF